MHSCLNVYFEGYVSLGDVMFRSHGGAPGALYSEVRCVKLDYVQQCEFGYEIWADHGSGADADVKVCLLESFLNLHSYRERLFSRYYTF